MLPSEAFEVVPFDKARGDVSPLEQRSVLAEQWERAFARMADLDANVGYLEARLTDYLRVEKSEDAIVPADPRTTGSSPFTQRLSSLVDRLEEQTARLEALQRRLDL